MALLSFANRNAYCWPSRRSLADLTGFSPNHLSRLTAELEAASFVHKKFRPNGQVCYCLLLVQLHNRSHSCRSPYRAPALPHPYATV